MSQELSTNTVKKCSMRAILALCMALAVITLAVYLQAGDHQFLCYDDGVYVYNNSRVTSGISAGNTVWAFTTFEQANWHPLTWLSHQADAQIYGMSPGGHHLTSVVIHTVSSLFLFLLLFQLTSSRWQSFFVAALFALHPLHVESVAWVAERKDVLSAFFWFLTLFFYSKYVAKRKPALYLLTLFAFVLGIMSKPMLVTLPLVMLLMDFWPLERYRKEGDEQGSRERGARVIELIKEKAPFFAFSLLSGLVTIYAQHKGGATRSLEALPLLFRLENALISYLTYIVKTLYPHNLAVFYPIPPAFPLWQVTGSLLFLLGVSTAAICSRRRYPYLMVGWFWFIITLLPVIGLIQVGDQSMADRYTYLPHLGLFIMASWGAADLSKNMKFRRSILVSLGGAAIFASAALTCHQLSYWQDTDTLFGHTLEVTAGNYVIHTNYGDYLAGKGNLDAAILEYQRALQINSEFPEGHNNLGVVLEKKGDLAAAIREYRETLRIKPDYSMAHSNLGSAFSKQGNLDASIKEYLEAIRFKPENVEAHNNLGIAYLSKAELDQAIAELQEALRISPDYPQARTNLGIALATKRMQEDARK